MYVSDPYGSAWSVQTDSEGTFSFNGLYGGSYLLYMEPQDGSAVAFATVSLGHSQVAAMDLYWYSIDPDADGDGYGRLFDCNDLEPLLLDDCTASALEGFVRGYDEVLGDYVPVSFVDVQAFQGTNNVDGAQTDETGYFFFPLLYPGAYHVFVAQSGEFEPFSQTFEVRWGEVQEREFTLNPLYDIDEDGFDRSSDCDDSQDVIGPDCNLGALRGTVRDGETGLLYEYGNVAELSERMLLLLKDATLRENLTLNAIEWAKGFDWDRAAGETIGLLLKRLEDSKRY